MHRTKFNEVEYEKSRQMLIDINKKIKGLLPGNFQKDEFEKAGHSEVSVGFMDGKAIERVIIILKGCGCAWVQEEEGGCTMCGHYSGSSQGEPISDQNLKKQFDSAMSLYDFRKYPMLCLYNGGSFINDKEISPSLRRYMLETVEANPHIKRLIIESRTDFITAEALDEIEDIMKTTEVEIGVGIETTCDVIRNLLLNKGVDTYDLIAAGNLFKNRRVKLLAYALVNPPFLTESEAIEDTVATIKFARDLGASVVSLEAVSIQHLTLVAYLAEAGFYTPPWIWSMFEIIRKMSPIDVEIRLGGFEFFPIPKEFTSNCFACNDEMVTKIQEYNKTNDLHVLDGVSCSRNCDVKWRNQLKEVDMRNYPQRIIQTLEAIDTPVVLERLKEQALAYLKKS